jgi:hypothetical protein
MKIARRLAIAKIATNSQVKTTFSPRICKIIPVEDNTISRKAAK